jgi:hypothetical protein
MTFAPATEDQIFAAYTERGLSLMRLAKLMDCRVTEIREALANAEARRGAWVPPAQFAAKVLADTYRHSRDLGEQRRGKRRRVRDEQTRQIGQRKAAVSLPSLSFLERNP